MKSDQLSTAQNGVHALKVLSIWLAIAVLALYALAVYLARGIRRQTIRNIGWGILIVGIIVLIVRRVMGNYIVEQLSSPGYERSTHNAWLIGTSILGEIGRATVMYGLITVLGAMLAGPTRIGTKDPQLARPDAQRPPGRRLGVVRLRLPPCDRWAPTPALHKWWGIFSLGGLLALGVYALRRQTLEEFPSTAAAAAAGGSRPSAGLPPEEGTSTMGAWALAAVAFLILVFAAFSRKLDRLLVTPAMFFTATACSSGRDSGSST